MQIQMYFKSSKFKSYIPDWITTLLLIFVFFVFLETAIPFTRQFSLSDQTISHPFAVVERVNDLQLYILSVVIPCIIIIVLSVINTDSELDKLHLIQVSNVGLYFTTAITSVLTDILKCLIGNPRPDFLQRCAPAASTATNILVGLEVCTFPKGKSVVLEGFKSTPSGHSSLAFSGLGYLTLWLLGQYRVLAQQTDLKQSGSRPKPIAMWLLLCSPLVLAAYVALSRTQDYRHHFFDIGLGSSIGVFFAYLGYYKYFNSLFDINSNLPVDYENVSSPASTNH